MGALVWLWPIATQPVPSFWPGAVAWSAAIWLWLVALSRREQSELIIAQGWLMAALLSAVLGIAQYFGLGDRLFPLVAFATPGYAYANTGQINHLASLLAVGLWVLAWMQRQGLLLRHLHWMAALMAIALAATTSRGGLLQLVLVTVLALWWGAGRRQQVFRLYAVAGVAYVVAVLALPWLLEHGLGMVPERKLLTRMAVEGTCSSRKVLWANVLDLITQKPWTGWGWNGLRYGFYTTLFENVRFCDMLANGHNLPLHLAVELGVPAAVALSLGAMGTVLWLRPWGETDANVQLGWGVLAVVGLHSMLEFPLWYGNFQVMVALALWLLWPAMRQRLGMVQPAPMPAMAWGRRLSITLVIQLVLAGMAWDYVRVSQLYIPPSERWAPWRENASGTIQNSVFFGDQILFSRVVTTDPALENAPALLNAALETLRISPEPRVIERVIVSASLLGRQDLVDFHAKRYAANWPKQYQAWRAAQAGADAALPPALP